MIDRRHVALGTAIAASVSSQPRDWPPLFYGDEALDAGPFTLDDKSPTRAWRITTDVVLPEEAGDHDFQSQTGVQVLATDPDSEDFATVSFGECGDEAIEGEWGSLVSIDDVFADCTPRASCTRTFCVEITSEENHAVEGAWNTGIRIESIDTVKHEDSIPVLIDITIEEIEP